MIAIKNLSEWPRCHFCGSYIGCETLTLKCDNCFIQNTTINCINDCGCSYYKHYITLLNKYRELEYLTITQKGA